MRRAVREVKRIFLIRHGESEANVDPSIVLDQADHAIGLTTRGRTQAQVAGGFLNNWLEHNISHQHKGRIRLWGSPYRRTRETADAIERECSDWVRDRREHILLCEQQFGLFDGVPEHKRREWYPEEWAHYDKCERQEGRFWARMPLGESRFDVATRIHQAFGTFHRDADRHSIDHIFVVCHGVTLRAFLMMWLHLTPEWFDSEPNPGNCAVRLIEDGNDQGYIYTGDEQVWINPADAS